MKILIVEDHGPTRELLARSLERDGHALSSAGTYAQALELSEAAVDVIVLDVMLPDGSGIELCRTLRARGMITPILLLTARGDVRDRLAGFNAGADDYLPKPFALAELLARIRVLGRRGPAFREQQIEVAGITVDLAGRQLLLGGSVIPITTREFAIIEVLALRRGRVVSGYDLLEMIWGEPTDSAKASLVVLIARIRRKLGPAGSALRTQRGTGYVLGEER